jgi:hypothetical protein
MYVCMIYMTAAQDDGKFILSGCEKKEEETKII